MKPITGFILAVIIVGSLGFTSWVLWTKPNLSNISQEADLLEGDVSPLESGIASITTATILDLYQQYYRLQTKRDAAGIDYDRRQLLAYRETASVKGKLSSDSTNIELHRRLIRAQNEWKQSVDDWLSVINPIDEQMDAIREELKSRGEPPPQ